MKDWKCDSCNKDIEVLDDYEPEYCCSGRECGCYGLPIDPVFCDDCEKKIYGISIDEKK